MRSNKFRRNSFASTLLKGLAITGIVLIAATSPYFGLAVIKDALGKNRKKEWKRTRNSLYHLKKRGLVRVITREGGIEVKLTEIGKKVAEFVNIDKIKLKKSNKWDGKWRLVIYDIPNDKSHNRMLFGQKLKELGFVLVQRSVWAYPYDCYKEIRILRDFYEIDKFVTYIETSSVEDEHLWSKHFKFDLRR